MSDASHAGSAERTLVARMAAGDSSALAELFDRFGPRVQVLARGLLGDQDDAEDIVEETFWQAWRTAGSFDAGRGSASSWLLTIAHSRAIDHLRTRRRRADWAAAPATAGALLDIRSPARETSNVRLGDAARRADALAAALAALPAEQRSAIEMAFLEGLSHGEIAERTGLPIGTLKTRIRLGMHKLRDALAFLREEAR